MASYYAVALAIPVGTAGDSMDRVVLRLLEILAAASVVLQLCTTATLLEGGVQSYAASTGAGMLCLVITAEELLLL